MEVKIKYFDGTEQTINMGDVSIENCKIYQSRNRENVDFEKNKKMAELMVELYNEDKQ